jgi:hypothetical protein
VHGLSQLPGALQASVDFVGLFTRVVVFRARPAVLLLLCLSVSYGFRGAIAAGAAFSTRGWYRLALAALGIAVCAWLLLLAATTPGYFAQEFDPPERAQFVAVWVVALALASAGYLLGGLVARAAWRGGLLARRRLLGAAWLVVLLLVGLGPFIGVRGTLAQVPADAAYAAEWDLVDATIRAQASPDQPVVLQYTLPNHYGFDFVGADPTFYPNPCVAEFYGVPSITAPADQGQ